MRLDLGEHLGPFLPAQWQGYDFDAPAGTVAIVGFFGGWGSGKTHGAARRFLRECTLAPYTSAYGANKPKSIVMAPSYPALQETTLPQLLEVIPSELILQNRGSPHNDIVLANGHRILKRSGEAEIEGDAVQVWLDEVHKPVWSQHPRRYLQAHSRLRDKRAPRKTMLVSGLPEQGWVRDTFDVPGPNRCTLLMSTYDNPFIDRSLLASFVEACPSGHEVQLLHGQWMLVAGVVYSQWEPSIHMVAARGNPAIPVHLGIDLGDRSACVILQPYPVTVQDIVGRRRIDHGMLVVGEIVGEQISADALCYRIRTETPWEVRPGKSVICVDPTASKDEIAAIRVHYPGVTVLRRKRGHACYPVESGITMVQRALMDALHNTRLFFSDHLLRGGPRGLVAGFQAYKRNNIGAIVKDNATDHILDALRYVVCEVLRSVRPQARVLP